MTALPLAASLPTGRRGQGLALALAAMLAALLWFGAVAPLLQAYADRGETLRQQQRLIGRMEALARTLPALRTQAMAAVQAGRDPAALLPGASDALAAATLQQRLDELAKASGVQIGSEEILPPRTTGAFRTITVRVTLHTPYSTLVALLQALSQTDLPMVVADLSVRASSPEAHERDLPVDAGFTISALREATEPAAESSTARRPSGQSTAQSTSGQSAERSPSGQPTERSASGQPAGQSASVQSSERSASAQSAARQP